MGKIFSLSGTIKFQKLALGLSCLKGFFAGLIFRGAFFQRDLFIRRNFAFQNGFGLAIKTAKTTEITA